MLSEIYLNFIDQLLVAFNKAGINAVKIVNQNIDHNIVGILISSNQTKLHKKLEASDALSINMVNCDVETLVGPIANVADPDWIVKVIDYYKECINAQK